MRPTRFSLLIFAVPLLLAACGHKAKLNIPPNSMETDMSKVHDMDTDGFLRMGKRMEDAGDYYSAAMFYSDAVKKDPGRIEGQLGMARMLDAANQPKQGALYYKTALGIDPNNEEAIRGYAKDMIASERAAEGAAAIDDYLTRNKPNPDILNLKGVALDLAGRFDEASSAYRQGLQLAGDDQDMKDILLGNLALSLGLGGDYSEAVILLNNYVGDMQFGQDSMTDSQSQLRQNLALVYALSGNPDAAVEVAKSALSEEDAEHNRSFYEEIGKLTGPDRARAVFLGTLPDDLS